MTSRSLTCFDCGTALHGDPSCPDCGTQYRIPSSGEPLSRMVQDIQERLERAVEGRYELRGLLGHGGMGAVFLAAELRLDRLVAIKVLPPSLSDDQALRGRFEREARTAARLDHPGIVPIYAVEDSEDLNFFVMKFVPGTDLRAEIEAGPMSVPRVREVLGQAAAALAHAHARGVVHRDVKPANIMIDEAGRAVLADFGIAKAVKADAQLTSTGQALGSPMYMSPEQFEAGEVDGRSDQYALGMVAYHMLAGRAPFESAAYATILVKQLTENPPSLKEVRPELPDALVAAVERAISKKPEDRFPDMKAFQAAIAGEAGAHPGTAGADRGGASAGGRGAGAGGAGRGRWAVAALALVVALGTGYVLVSGGGESDGPTVPPRTAVEGLASRSGAGQASDAATAEGGEDVGGQADPAVAGDEPAAEVDAGAPPERDPSSPPATAGGDAGTGERTAAVGTESSGTTATASGPPVTTPPATPPAAQVGFLTVNAQPVFAYVEVDGVELLNSTPVFRHELAPGSHVLTIRREGFATVVDTVEVTAGNETRRSYVLIAN